MDTLADVAHAYAGHLADLYEAQSRWRLGKADQFRDDARNLRSSQALAAASEYVRSIENPADHATIGRLVQLALVLETWRLPPIGVDVWHQPTKAAIALRYLPAPSDLVTPLDLPMELVSRAVSRPGNFASGFFFDEGRRPPTGHDFERLLEATFLETLESWRDILGTVPLVPPEDFPAPLLEFFDAQGVSLLQEEDDDA